MMVRKAVARMGVLHQEALLVVRSHSKDSRRVCMQGIKLLPFPL